MDAEKPRQVVAQVVVVHQVDSEVVVAVAVAAPLVHSAVQVVLHVVVRSPSARRRRSTRSCTHLT